MSDAPATLAGACRHSQEIRRSRFLAHAAPVATPAEAIEFLRHASDPAATHNCWAYRIGQDYRFNDDGEPGGTAGRPILQAIEGQSMDRVAVIVTRWYGGIKLGAGGLARAYGGTAAECLRVAERAPIVAMAWLDVHCDFSELALLKARLKELQADIGQEQSSADGVDLTFRLPRTRVDEASLLVSDISRGRSVARPLD